VSFFSLVDTDAYAAGQQDLDDWRIGWLPCRTIIFSHDAEAWNFALRRHRNLLMHIAGEMDLKKAAVAIIANETSKYAIATAVTARPFFELDVVPSVAGVAAGGADSRFLSLFRHAEAICPAELTCLPVPGVKSVAFPIPQRGTPYEFTGEKWNLTPGPRAEWTAQLAQPLRTSWPLAHCGSSDLYGHSTLLVRYCGMSGTLIRGRVQHGWTPTCETITEDSSYITRFYTWSERMSSSARARAKDAYTIGSTILYLPPMPDPGFVKKNSIVAFPHHGLWLHPMKESWVPYAEWLREFAQQRPVTVCLYPSDYENAEVRETFLSLGFSVTCAGTHYDSNFLRRIRLLIWQHDLLVTNRLSTPVFYALYLGREFHIGGPTMTTTPPDLGEDMTADPAWVAKNFPVIDKDVMRFELGLDHKLSPDDLRNLIWGWVLLK